MRTMIRKTTTQPQSPDREAHVDKCDCGMIREGREPSYWERDSGNHSTGCAFMRHVTEDRLAYLKAMTEWRETAKQHMREGVRSDIAIDYVKHSGLLRDYGDLSLQARYLAGLADIGS
jgi:hypothetical protein